MGFSQQGWQHIISAKINFGRLLGKLLHGFIQLSQSDNKRFESAAQGEGATLNQETLAKHCESEIITDTLSNLLQYELIESTPKGYRFQIELIRRWFEYLNQN